MGRGAISKKALFQPTLIYIYHRQFSIADYCQIQLNLH
jgi:hypothetical protein